MISVIIPALNEEQNLRSTLESLRANRSPHEVIVVDGGSSDRTVETARQAGARVLVSPRRHRAAQMNFGAAQGSGDILFFLHADTRIRPSALERIERLPKDRSIAGGGFLRYFDSPSLFLRLTCWISGIRCRVSGLFLGDQGIFVRREIFEELGGFKELDLFEDVDLCRRMKKRGRVVTAGPPVLSSARRFDRLGPVATTFSDLSLSLRYIRGADPNLLAAELRRGPARSLSVIIPTLNEEGTLPALLASLKPEAEEIIVVDGGSADRTVEIARGAGARLIESERGRALQLNAGAAQAKGDILWFLHADTKLSAGWKEPILSALRDPRVAGGGFRVRIDARGPGYRFLDFWGGIRAGAQRSLYGDQGIFVRRDIFEKLGGFPDWPLFEDVGFSERLFRAGKVKILPGPLVTSARRWQKQGWWRTVLRHSSLAWAHQFQPRLSAPVRLIVMAKSPQPGKVKTRLMPAVGPEEATRIAERLLKEAVVLARHVSGADPVVAVAPPEGMPQVRALIGGGIRLIPQPEGDLGARLSGLFRDAFNSGAAGVIAVGTDHPNLPREYLERAVKGVKGGGDRIMLGPTEDGGYYLVGMSRFHPEIFERISWSTSTVLQETLERAKSTGAPVELLPEWFDLDRPEDLARLPAGFLGKV